MAEQTKDKVDDYVEYFCEQETECSDIELKNLGEEVKWKTDREKLQRAFPLVVLPSSSCSSAHYHHSQKIIIIGESGVGKTSLVYSYKYGPAIKKPIDFRPNTGASYDQFQMSLSDNFPVKLTIWDTAGQEKHRCLSPSYTRNSHAVILVYDVTDRRSFDKVDDWHNNFRHNMYPSADVIEPVFILVGNKADLKERREVAEGEGVTKALRFNARFFELSIFDYKVITSMFKSVAEEVHKNANGVENAVEADEGMFTGRGTDETGEANIRSNSCCSAI